MAPPHALRVAAAAALIALCAASRHANASLAVARHRASTKAAAAAAAAAASSSAVAPRELQSCGAYSGSCSSCASNSNCMYCVTSSTCVSLAGTCPGATAFVPDDCTCSSYSGSCGNCVNADYYGDGCEYCGSTRQTVLNAQCSGSYSLETSQCSGSVQKTSAALCSSLSSSCTSCVAPNVGCGYCGPGQCYDLNTLASFTAATCENPSIIVSHCSSNSYPSGNPIPSSGSAASSTPSNNAMSSAQVAAIVIPLFLIAVIGGRCYFMRRKAGQAPVLSAGAVIVPPANAWQGYPQGEQTGYPAPQGGAYPPRGYLPQDLQGTGQVSYALPLATTALPAAPPVNYTSRRSLQTSFPPQALSVAPPGPPPSATPEAALLRASHEGREDIVRYLLAQGANANGKNASGATPLMYASFGGHLAIVRILCNQPGADLFARDSMGKTALGLAMLENHEAVARFLRTRGAAE